MKRVCGFVAIAALVAVCALIGCKAKPSVSLTLEKSVFAPGETITVKYRALPAYDASAWIGIIPADIVHGSEAENDRHDIAYQHLNKDTAGTMTFTAPRIPGAYDFRMHDTDANGVEVASVAFSVLDQANDAQPKTAAAPAASTDMAEPANPSFAVGDEVTVEWRGSWWPAKVIAMREGAEPFKIHYDGYTAAWDEWIGSDRIKKRSLP